MRVAIYAGSFDPLHYGHVNIAFRSLGIFDSLIMAIGQHPHKKSIIKLQDRKVMIEQTFKGQPVTVHSFDSLLVDFVADLEEDFPEDQFFLVRGLRDGSDFQYEAKLAFANRDLAPNANETVFLLTDPEYANFSSTLIRELMSYEQTERCRKFLPSKVWEIIEWRKDHPGTVLLDNDIKQYLSD